MVKNSSTLQKIQTVQTVKPAAKPIAKPSYEELMARIEQLESEKNRKTAITYKVSAEKQAMSIYGFGRMPLSPYLYNYLRLLADARNGLTFAAANFNEFSFKTEFQRKESEQLLANLLAEFKAIDNL